MRLTYLPPLTRRRGISKTERSALLGGAFVLLGAVIAAAAGTFGLMLQQRYDDHRILAGEELRAQGAARILGVDLQGSVAQMRALRDGGRLRALDQPLTVEMASEDYVLVAGKMPENGWGSVAVALSLLTEMNEYIADRAKSEAGRQLTQEERCALAMDIGIVTFATYELSALTDQPTRSPIRVPQCGSPIPNGPHN